MARIFIGRLADKASERDVERFFKGYGKIRDIRLKTGYGFVEFEDERDADDAIHDLHHKELAGGRVVLELARSGRRSPKRFDSSRRYAGNAPVRTDYRLLVENLPSRVSWQDLKDLMRKTGEVMFADAHKRRQNEGIVEFKTRADMKAALKKFDGYEISGRKLRVFEDSAGGSTRSKKSRSLSRSRSSHSRRGRRSSRRSSSRRRSSRRSTSRSRSRSVSRRSTSRSKSPLVKDKRVSRSRSMKSKTPLNNGINRRDKSVSHKKSISKVKSRSISNNRSRSRPKVLSRSHSKEVSRSPSKEVSRSPSKEASRSSSKEASRSPSKEASRSPSKEATRSPSKKISRSISKEVSRSRSKTHSSTKSRSEERVMKKESHSDVENHRDESDSRQDRSISRENSSTERYHSRSRSASNNSN